MNICEVFEEKAIIFALSLSNKEHPQSNKLDLEHLCVVIIYFIKTMASRKDRDTITRIIEQQWLITIEHETRKDYSICGDSELDRLTSSALVLQGRLFHATEPMIAKLLCRVVGE